jgi:uncharacterized membrane protein YhaH (DUF805 family)
MTQAATFGRRGTIAPPLARPNQPRPASKAPSPVAPAAMARPKTRDDSLPVHFLWLLFSFSGRLDRRTYRYARIVANLGFLFAFSALNAQLVKSIGAPGVELGLVFTLLGLLGLMSWTTLAMQVKRRHDRDKSWPWLFVGFIPFIGSFWVLVETCWLDGTPGYNRFDDASKVAAEAFA